MIKNTDFRPDWTQWYESKEKMFQDIGNKDEYKGAGWYITKGCNPNAGEHADALLIFEENTNFLVMCWNHHDVFNALHNALKAPIHLDQR